MIILGEEKIIDPLLKKKILMQVQYLTSKNIYDTDEFATILNPKNVYPTYDLYPLAQKLNNPLVNISAILTDMDGTTTTTETLCLHSLEHMIQVVTKNKNNKSVRMLNKAEDYPHIIGNSTTKHVEYLINKYGQYIDKDSFINNFLFAVLWTKLYGKDQSRSSEVTITFRLLGIEKEMIEVIEELKKHSEISSKDLFMYVEDKLSSIKQMVSFDNFSMQVRMAIDIYYQRYHEILIQIEHGNSEKISKKLTHGKPLIEPMKGIAFFLSLIKGLLGKEAKALSEETGISPKTLTEIGKFFQKNPVKIGLVTSSIAYEAYIVLNEVFKVISYEIKNWPISSQTKDNLLIQFSKFQNVYDAVVTASDSHEIRLKPHRDLYSIALLKLGIPANQFNSVIGFEDSESGLIAIRAAGIGRAIGIPFEATKGHDMKAASLILKNGIYEFIGKNHCFLSFINDLL